MLGDVLIHEGVDAPAAVVVEQGGVEAAGGGHQLRAGGEAGGEVLNAHALAQRQEERPPIRIQLGGFAGGVACRRVEDVAGEQAVGVIEEPGAECLVEAQLDFQAGGVGGVEVFPAGDDDPGAARERARIESGGGDA